MHNTGTTEPYKQLELITPEPPISETNLIAGDSPRIAFYRVSIYYLPGAGYRIEKCSGAAGSKGEREDYWRPSLKLALEKKTKLLKAKLRKRKSPRQYIHADSSGITEENHE